MDIVSDIFARFGAWLWFVLAVALMIFETIVPGIHFLWFGLAAGAVGLLSLIVPFAWPWQVIIFAVVSTATVALVRSKNNPDAVKTDEPVLNIRGAHYIGRTVTVEDAIVNGRGKVRVGDTFWGAEGEDAPRGARVVVTGVNGTVLVVTSEDDKDWGA